MAKKREIIDPTLPFTPITIKGKEYKMCFDYGAICKAEIKFREAGQKDVLLLMAAPNYALVENLRFLFACSLQTFHPEVAYEEGLALVTPRNQGAIFDAIHAAWKDAMPDPAQGSPTEPEEEPGA